ncbi:PspC domain-containing protein [Nonomuraea sp. NPDC050328]|uniref:PspC domain-containing protein n=1 Tax=Nonomuraea sp. NPDC050328 TaxID=3364361 RepID=UPI0037A08542
MNETKQLRRTQQGRMIAGVCSGVGQYIGVDPNIIRIALAILTLFGGAGIAAYAIGWLLLPDEGRPSIVQDLISKQQHKASTASDTQQGNPWHDAASTEYPGRTEYPYPPQAPQSAPYPPQAPQSTPAETTVQEPVTHVTKPEETIPAQDTPVTQDTREDKPQH